jgi:hypothetical protein
MTAPDDDGMADDWPDARVVHVYRRRSGVWALESILSATRSPGPATSSVTALPCPPTATGSSWGADSEDGGTSGVDGDASDDAGANAGAAYVFGRSGDGWQNEAYLKASIAREDRFFGHAGSISGDGDTVAVGATRDPSDADGVGGHAADDSAPRAGSVYVFFDDGGERVEQACIEAGNSDADDSLGWAVDPFGRGFRWSRVSA